MSPVAPRRDAAKIPTVAWVDGAVEMIDQTLLPLEEKIARCPDVPSIVDAIRRHDGPAAEVAMRRHLGTLLPDLVRLQDQHPDYFV